MKHVLIPRVHGSIPMKCKNFTSERDGEYREVAVPRSHKMVGLGLLQ
jgi:hypothetical protein